LAVERCTALKYRRELATRPVHPTKELHDHLPQDFANTEGARRRRDYCLFTGTRCLWNHAEDRLCPFIEHFNPYTEKVVFSGSHNHDHYDGTTDHYDGTTDHHYNHPRYDTGPINCGLRRRPHPVDRQRFGRFGRTGCLLPEGRTRSRGRPRQHGSIRQRNQLIAESGLPAGLWKYTSATTGRCG